MQDFGSLEKIRGQKAEEYTKNISMKLQEKHYYVSKWYEFWHKARKMEPFSFIISIFGNKVTINPAHLQVIQISLSHTAFFLFFLIYFLSL